MSQLGQDVRLALRRLRQRPAFTSVAVLTLALGLGANTAVFTLVHALILRSLPVERPRELYRLGDTTDCCVNSGLAGSYSLFSFRLFEHLKANAPEFTDLAAFQATTVPRQRDGGRLRSLPSRSDPATSDVRWRAEARSTRGRPSGGRVATEPRAWRRARGSSVIGRLSTARR
jgi:hypothetical protein